MFVCIVVVLFAVCDSTHIHVNTPGHLSLKSDNNATDLHITAYFAIPLENERPHICHLRWHPLVRSCQAGPIPEVGLLPAPPLF